jgi:hypothetical protein
MADWVTPDHLEILDEHKPAYDDASSEDAQQAVLKSITQKLRLLGRKGLPKKLAKVGERQFLCCLCLTHGIGSVQLVQVSGWNRG